MSQRTQDDFLDADQLSLDFLIVECIWDPSSNQGDDGETLHPKLLRHLTGDDVERGDFTLRYWRGDFYSWKDGRHIRISESDMKVRIVRHLKEHNRHSETFDRPGRRINITNGLVTNVLLCLARTEGVHLDESRQLNTWDDGRQRMAIQTLAFANGLLLTDRNSEHPAMAKPTSH